MTSFSTGRQAEQIAANYLQQQGYQILNQNWRTRYCEIDIVARKATVVYFVEVKYRSSRQQGDGLDYITAQKLRQMTFASALWVQSHSWSGDYRLLAVAVDKTRRLCATVI